MTSVGFGNVAAETDNEKIFTICMMIIAGMDNTIVDSLILSQETAIRRIFLITRVYLLSDKARWERKRIRDLRKESTSNRSFFFYTYIYLFFDQPYYTLRSSVTLPQSSNK